jgi:hypothetical protein
MLHTGGRFSSERYDCVVVGSGPAGMSLALALADAKRKVLLLESGHEEADTTGLANAIGYGHYSGGYWNAHWSRTLGGTSNVWSGWCAPLRDIDFDNPAVGVRWPISRSDLVPYWQKAAPILDHNPSFIDFEAPLYPGFDYRPIPVAGPTRFATKYRDRLNGSAGIDVGLGCSAVGLEANESRSLVTRVEYVHHPTDEQRELTLDSSQSIVLAAGGIGNAQLLLQPRPGGGVPVGNESGLGRQVPDGTSTFSQRRRVRDRRGARSHLAISEPRPRYARSGRQPRVLARARLVRLQPGVLPEDGRPANGPVPHGGARTIVLPLLHSLL